MRCSSPTIPGCSRSTRSCCRPGCTTSIPQHRNLRLLGADLVYELPGLAYLARRAGHTRACPANADRLLHDGELVGVFPEGFKGIGKPFSDRYQLRRFGRGGFAVTALRARVPIVPCAIVGAEEIYPMVGNARPLARLLRLPYFPITPLFPWFGPLGAVPLPSKWIIDFGPPVETSGYPRGRVAGSGGDRGTDRRGQRQYPGEAGRPDRGARPRVRMSLAGPASR